MQDLTGLTFGRLTVLGYDGTRGSTVVRWRCKCDCGKEVVVKASDLVGQRVADCGCRARRRAYKVDAGSRFGKLVAAERTGKACGDGSEIWRCACDCGRSAEVPESKLLDGTVTSCGVCD